MRFHSRGRLIGIGLCATLLATTSLGATTTRSARTIVIPAGVPRGQVRPFPAPVTRGQRRISRRGRRFSVPTCTGSGTASFVGGGSSNVAGGAESGVLSGLSNDACDGDSAIGAGAGNGIGGAYDEFIGAGFQNAVTNAAAGFIGAGHNNTVSFNVSAIINGFIGAGNTNTVSNTDAFIGAGELNQANGVDSAIVAGNTNSVLNTDGFIGAGELNNNSGVDSAIVAGKNNLLTNTDGFIGAGFNNNVSNTDGFIGAGESNNSTGLDSGIVSGKQNSASGSYGAIGGGLSNTVTAASATVGGGFANHANGGYATVPGGYGNTATGAVSFAAGHGSYAAHSGAFVWSDNASGATQLKSSGVNQFLARASGGVALYTNTTLTTGVMLGAGSGTWGSVSDRAVKTNVVQIDDVGILDKVASLPISEWSYISEHGVRHVGPMAQDFYAAFGVGEDNKHITSIDEDGVALAAIKALHSENRTLKTKIAKMERQLQQLSAAFASMGSR